MEKGKTKDKLAKARERLMQQLPIEKVRKVAKYRNLTMEQYLILVDKLEILAITTLESYIFDLNDQL